jgi:hypothetical protein
MLIICSISSSKSMIEQPDSNFTSPKTSSPIWCPHHSIRAYLWQSHCGVRLLYGKKLQRGTLHRRI